MELDAIKHQQLSTDSFYVIADWYHYAILNIIRLDNFKSDPKWIAKCLGLSVVEVRGALERLERVGLIKWERNKLVRTTGSLTTTHDIESEALRRSHRQSLELSIKILQ